MMSPAHSLYWALIPVLKNKTADKMIISRYMIPDIASKLTLKSN
jgi:hypothetical protein